MNRKDTTEYIVYGLTILAISIGGIMYMEDHYAKAAALRKTDGKLEYHLIDIRFTSVRERLWTLKAKFGEDCHKLRKDCIDTKNELDDIKREMERTKK